MDTDNRTVHDYVSALIKVGINVPMNVQRAVFRLDLGARSRQKQFLADCGLSGAEGDSGLTHYDVHQKKMWEKETEALGLPVVRHHDEEQHDGLTIERLPG